MEGKEIKFELRRTIQVTTFIIIYILYPRIASLTFSLFNCTAILDEQGNETAFLTSDLSIQCWTQSHYYYAFIIGIPFTVFYIVGFPLLIFLILYKKRPNLNDKDVVLSYGLFFVGLEDSAFFWEIVVSNFRKVLYIIGGAFLSQSNQTIKVRLQHLMLIGNRRGLHDNDSNATLPVLQALHRPSFQHDRVPLAIRLSKPSEVDKV